VLMVEDVVIGKLGNFSASIGKVKSKKTFNVSTIAASALSGGIVLHYRPMFPENKKKILYIDTEAGTTLSKIWCKWKQDSAVSLFLYLDSVFLISINCLFIFIIFHYHSILHREALFGYFL